MEPDGHVVCRVYTRARRHPNVIGVIGGWTLPWPLTPTQLGVLLGSFVALATTRRLWSIVLPGSLNTMVLAGAPIFLCWAVRHLRMEGRSPVRMAAGLASYLAKPRQGTLHGRPLRIGKRCCFGGRLFIGAGGLTAANGSRRPRRGGR